MSEAVRFEELYKYYPGVLTLLRRLGFSADEARDIAQESYVRILRSQRDYRGEAHWSYLEKVVRRVAMNEVRSRHSAKRAGEQVTDEILITIANQDDPHAELLAKEQATDQHRRVAEAIAKLPADARAALLLRLEGLSYEEIAATLGITVDSVKSRLKTTRHILKKNLVEAIASDRRRLRE